MTVMLRKGGYAARIARNPADLVAAQRLRHLCFIERGGVAPRPDRREGDSFDQSCSHVLVEDQRTGQLVCCFRLMLLQDGADIGRSYAGQYYDLKGLETYPGAMAELGRFCIHPDSRDPDVLRVAWAAITRFVDDANVALLFGCSSFAGTSSEVYSDAFDMLSERHIAPPRWRPGIKAPHVLRFVERFEARDRMTDRREGMLRMPPLLRSYLAMGGWVSDHAVVDADLNTLHVFTGLEIRAIPAARARALRAVAGQ